MLNRRRQGSEIDLERKVHFGTSEPDIGSLEQGFAGSGKQLRKAIIRYTNRFRIL